MSAVLQSPPFPPTSGAIAHLADSDLWGSLAALFDANPGWSDETCRTVLQAWVEVRRRHPWQAKLLRFWQRWKHHHDELARGLVHAKLRSWAQKCRFCEIWSANRPVMSPFCGVADILLGTPTISGIQALVPPRVAGSDVIVVSSDVDSTRFAEFGASRQLLWALEQSGLSWRLLQPWDAAGLALDPQTVHGVIFWSHRHRSNDFVYHAMGIERSCHALGIPVINSIINGWDVRHSTILQRFDQAGLRCPKFEKFVSVDDITLPYPLILRVDGIHRGQQMRLVHDAEEARAVERSARAAFLMGGSGVVPPPNLALEYIDVSDHRGQFHKFRAYVVGDQVLMRHRTSGTHWLVNFASSESVSGAFGDPNVELLAHAGRVTGSDVTALDYSITRDGEYVFWEANRLFKMSGDAGYGQQETLSESRLRRRAAADRQLGQSLLTLLRERFAHLP